MLEKENRDWDEHYDFVSIGSGAAGLTGALISACNGDRSVVLEATDMLGGTTAYSGSLLWVPFNKHAERLGYPDSRDAAESYVSRVLGDRGRTLLWKAFFDHVNDAVAEITKHTGAEFHLTAYPDSYGEWEEGRTCRHLNIDPYPVRRAGSMHRFIRKSPTPSLFTITEVIEGGLFIGGLSAVLPLLPKALWRLATKRMAMGAGLVAALLAGCRQNGVKVHRQAKVIRLITDKGGSVTGVECIKDSRRVFIKARKAVLLASGGFDWNKHLCDKYIPDRHECHITPPVNWGDNIKLAQTVDAKLASMDEAWNLPAARISETDRPEVNWQIVGDRTWPHSVMVNREAKRFVNESSQNAAESFYLKGDDGRYKHLPCWIIYDQQYIEKYPVLTKRRKQHVPDWLYVGETLEELASQINLPYETLQKSIERFNHQCRQGIDDDFGRGDGCYERYFGDRKAKHPCLGTIEQPPFYAIKVKTSSVGTKGGPVINNYAQVMSNCGNAINGLYAAGNAAAAFNGPSTVAAGCTLSPAITMAYIAAKHSLKHFE